MIAWDHLLNVHRHDRETDAGLHARMGATPMSAIKDGTQCCWNGCGEINAPYYEVKGKHMTQPVVRRYCPHHAEECSLIEDMMIRRKN